MQPGSKSDRLKIKRHTFMNKKNGLNCRAVEFQLVMQFLELFRHGNKMKSPKKMVQTTLRAQVSRDWCAKSILSVLPSLTSYKVPVLQFEMSALCALRARISYAHTINQSREKNHHNTENRLRSNSLLPLTLATIVN